MVPWVGLQCVTVVFPGLLTYMYFIRLGNKDESIQAAQFMATNKKSNFGIFPFTVNLALVRTLELFVHHILF